MAKDNLLEYLDTTKQSMEELMAGAAQTGMAYVLDELVPKALEEKKVIVWIDEDLETGKGHYELQDPL